MLRIKLICSVRNYLYYVLTNVPLLIAVVLVVVICVGGVLVLMLLLCSLFCCLKARQGRRAATQVNIPYEYKIRKSLL